MPIDVRVPTTGNAGEDAVLVEWTVPQGADVAAGDVLAVLETAKSSLEVDAPVSGRLVRTLFAVGDEVPEHGVLAVIAEVGEKLDEPGPTVRASSDALSEQPSTAATAMAEAAVQAVPAPRAEGRGADAPAASPRARTLAARRGIELGELRGSGPGGRIIISDVLAVAQAPSAFPRAGAAASGTTATSLVAATQTTDGAPARLYSTVDVRGARKITAHRMLASLQQTAQVTLTRYAVADALLALSARLKQISVERGTDRIGVNDLLLFATARTLAAHPALNSWFDGDRIRRFASVDLGFAVDTGDALLVPVIRDAEVLSLGRLAEAARDAIVKARSGKLTAAEMSGGSVTVSNLGGLGVHFFTPVLNPPQSCIVGIGAVHRVQGQPALLPLSLTFDHRALDGAAAAAGLAQLASTIESIDVEVAL